MSHPLLAFLAIFLIRKAQHQELGEVVRHQTHRAKRRLSQGDKADAAFVIQTVRSCIWIDRMVGSSLQP